jgi:sterol desaturase/sphingolipid hydroxylase (fatty acid hydroxylase superfamily)
MWALLTTRLGGLPAVATMAVVALPVLWLAVLLLRRLGIGNALEPSQRSLRTDLAYVVLSPISEAFSRTISTLCFAGLGWLVGRGVGPELLAGFGPVAKQPRWLIVIEMLVLTDFIYYWTHRLAHTVPLLWRFHSIHHSTRHLRWTSAMRVHPGEFYGHLVTLLPLLLLGFPVDALVPLTPAVTLYAFFIHTRSNVSFRAVRYLVNTPRFHGWHHARDISNGTKNFAGFFPVFDAIFGTYHLPEFAPEEVGIDDPTMPESCAGQLAHAFRRGPEGGEEASPRLVEPSPEGALGPDPLLNSSVFAAIPRP